MPIDHVFRTTGQLGPGLRDHEAEFWFLPPTTYSEKGTLEKPEGHNDKVDVSPRLGTIEHGSDGGHYVLAEAGAAFDASSKAAPVALDPKFKATAGAAGKGHEVPAGFGKIAVGEFFWARVVVPA